MVVEPEAGTTLDSVDSEWRTPGGTFTLVDTAGMRKTAHFKDEPEFFGSLRAIAALGRADLACVVVDDRVLVIYRHMYVRELHPRSRRSIPLLEPVVGTWPAHPSSSAGYDLSAMS